MTDEIKHDDAVDAIRALAACYDEQLLRSDHVVDDLFVPEGRGWLTLHADNTGEYQTVLTREGRQQIVRLLIVSQERMETSDD